ncbi:hypothetical protein VTJ04DRAFT_3519 [Mycothermus thermophilus]|uniref:uncharacterized protein n=1 Tax=Humicola insolens TaxID=85995 RepID=UPI00374270E8
MRIPEPRRFTRPHKPGRVGLTSEVPVLARRGDPHPGYHDHITLISHHVGDNRDDNRDENRGGDGGDGKERGPCTVAVVRAWVYNALYPSFKARFFFPSSSSSTTRLAKDRDSTSTFPQHSVDTGFSSFWDDILDWLMRGAGGGAYGFLKRECLQKSSHIGPDEPGLKDEIVSESDQLVVKLRLRLAEIEAIPYTNDFNQPCTDGWTKKEIYRHFMVEALAHDIYENRVDPANWKKRGIHYLSAKEWSLRDGEEVWANMYDFTEVICANYREIEQKWAERFSNLCGHDFLPGEQHLRSKMKIE